VKTVKAIVGLGNPGRTYHQTRHNVGFMIIDLLAQRHNVRLTQPLVSPRDRRPACVFGEYDEGGQAVRLLMPLTMMNESGEALRAIAFAPADLLLVCDDVNLPLGTLRLRPEGSAGGHHGMQSCLEALGTEQVARLRLGVGVEPLPRELHGFVLSPFLPVERPQTTRMVAQAADACETWIKEGIEVAMNQYNRVVG
jgi:PTH1 family peptidyl-tRNA hydrolase